MSSTTQGTEIRDPWKHRVDSGDWEAITAEINSLGGALLPELLTPGEAEQIRGSIRDRPVRSARGWSAAWSGPSPARLP